MFRRLGIPSRDVTSWKFPSESEYSPVYGRSHPDGSISVLWCRRPHEPGVIHNRRVHNTRHSRSGSSVVSFSRKAGASEYRHGHVRRLLSRPRLRCLRQTEPTMVTVPQAEEPRRFGMQSRAPPAVRSRKQTEP